MFHISWATRAFTRMQQIVSENPVLKDGFVYTLQSLTMELETAADTWGESRTGNFRLGFVGVLSVLIRVNAVTHVARVVDVRLLRRRSN